MMSDFEITRYVYNSESDYLQISNFYDLNQELFYFTNGQIYDKDKNKINEIELVESLKRYIRAFKNKIEKFEHYIIESEKIFENNAHMSTFNEKYHAKKYNLKKFSSILRDFYEAIELTISEQPQLRKKLKSIAYSAKLFKNETDEFIARIDDINGHIKSIITDKITRNIYILTIMSALFLPLNLITGFFGMNTNKMFLSNYANGTLIVAYAIFIITILFIISWIFYQKKT